MNRILLGTTALAVAIGARNYLRNKYATSAV